jgi:hypothetical protein
VTARPGGQLLLTIAFDVEIPGLDLGEPEPVVLYPADSTGDNFLFRYSEHGAWVPARFGRLSDQTPYVYVGGRVVPSED